MWTEEPGCRFFVVVDWAMVCVVYRVWYVWCWGGLAVFLCVGWHCWWSVVMAAVAGVEDNGFYFSPAKTEEK